MLLAFDDAAQEAAFTTGFQRMHIQQDVRILCRSVPLTLLVGVRPLLACSWFPVALSVVESCLLGLLALFISRRPAAYGRHRSLICAGVYLTHHLVSLRC